MTLALLLTAVTGAWAQTETLLTTITATGTEQASYSTANVATVSFSNLPDNSSHYTANWGWWGYGFTVTVTAAEGSTITKCVFYDNDGASATDSTDPFIVETEEQDKKPKVNGATFGAYTSAGIKKIEVYGYVTPADPAVEVTTNAASAQDLFTEAWFNMPAFDATVDYLLVRDMQDETNPVNFTGLPSSGNIVVKKGSDGKYQPAEALTIQLIDPLAAADAQNIIAADGITVKVLVGAENEKGAIDYDDDNPITLDAFLADMKPGYYWIKAEPTDENSPYDGTVYSQEFLLLNGYELTIPAGEYATFYKDENLYTEDENAELYTISEVNATQAVLSDAVQIMPKNTPMLVYNKGTEEKTFLLIPTEDEANQVTAANEFKGTLSTMGMPGSTSITDYYVCTGKAFRWVKNAGTIAANKCWLQIGEQPATTRANTRSIVGGGNTTGIDGIENDESAVEGYYDLNGRKLQGKPTRGGIYIQNGRKVIVR